MATESAALVVKNKKKAKNANKVHFWGIECRYSVILDVVTSLNWRIVDDERLESKVNLFWIDVAAIHERFRTIQPWQMINHFPGMPNIARKNRMGQNLNRMQRLFPKEYAFYPRTWVLPGEISDFRTQFDSNGLSLNGRIFIIKPDAGCQGRGIFLTRTLDTVPSTENVVAQVYIKKPLLLDNFKFDLRIYVYVAGVKPLRMYLFHDGLVRMCTEEYVKPTKANLHMSCMHLTNYAVNKHNNNFTQPNGIEDQDHSSKRSLQWFMQFVANTYGQDKADWLWRRIGVLCTRTVLSILPTLSREYDAHFRTFGGIPVDASLIPASASSMSNKLPAAPGSKKMDEEEEEEEKDDKEEDKKAEDPLQPKTRGSRCFEILGFDIMIDNNLNPTLIEVNHLPSFGTDSALDLDVKERLMQQVFSVLPPQADDFPAYVAHCKAEAEKRQAEKAANMENSRNNQKIWKTGTASNAAAAAAARPRREISVERRVVEESPSPPVVEELPVVVPVAPVVVDPPAEIVMPPLIEAVDSLDEECTVERLEEIKAILIKIYTIFSAEKISKIDRLLLKYLGHEEEFLRFVYNKYNVSPSQYEKPKPVSVPVEQSRDDSDTRSVHTAIEHTDGHSSRGDSKRYSRSLSPPRTKKLPPAAPIKKQQPAWKAQPDEDAIFRAEILKEHVPNDEEEWMKFEMSRLSQFTRIFPPLPKSAVHWTTSHLPVASDPPVAAVKEVVKEENDAEDEEENKEEEDEDETNATPSATGTSTTDTKKKVASYEDIICSVFLQDRRQTMRLRCPLPNRTKEEQDRLPPLESSSSRPLQSMGSGKGVVGWKAPPKPAAKETVKQPTVSQLEAAKRLSQGISVAANAANAPLRARNGSGSVGDSYSVVLDPAEYAAAQQTLYTNNGQVNGGVYSSSAANEVIWPSTKANRLYEESRRNRMRVEAQRSHNGAVLRQQVFFFDPNYDNIAVGAPVIGAAGPPLQPGNPGNLNINTVPDGIMTDSVYGGNGGLKARPPAQPLSLVANKSPTYLHTANIHAMNNYAMATNAIYANAMNNAGIAGQSTPKQEELLKQLFPSWF